MKNQRIFAIVGFCTLTACGAATRSAQYVSAKAVQNVGCKASQSEMWNSLHAIAERSATFPSASELRTSLLKTGLDNGLKGSAYTNYVEAFVENYSVTIEGIKSKFDPKDPTAWKKALAEMEIGARITDLHAELNDQINASLSKLDSAETALQAVCKNPDDQSSGVNLPSPGPGSNSSASVDKSIWDQLQRTQPPEVLGMRKTLAVAYQSCDVLALPPVTKATPNIEGIRDEGKRAQDVGHTRSIASLSQLQKTDYYLAGQRPAKNGCFNVQDNPLIYNFGGKPYTTSSDVYKMDLFTHVNGGGPTLGIDCSAYVFSALALGGLKTDMDSRKILKANLVDGISSGMLKEPQSNGLRCLKKISVDAKVTILPGDIAAINGHVFMIDSIGRDPLALAEIKSLADCTVANINPTKFDFTIAQSAPVKNGMGINRHNGADYMPHSATFANGFVAYAVAACRAKFGASAQINSPNMSVVRHLKTPECMAPKPLTMVHEDCVQSCHPL